MNYAEDQLLLMLKQKAYQKGEFVLASGKTTDFYIDCRKVTTATSGLWLTGRVFCKYINKIDPNIKAIAAEGFGAISIAVSATMVFEKQIHSVLIRKAAKEYGNKSLLEGNHSLVKDDNIILVEDVITTGNSVIKAANILKNAGYNVKSIIALVDREEGGKDNIIAAGYPIKCIFAKKDIIG